MTLSGKNPQAGAQPQAEAQPQALPLFRPEALAAQEKLHGDVLRIRPLPLAFFAWLAAAVVAGALIIFMVVAKK